MGATENGLPEIRGPLAEEEEDLDENDENESMVSSVVDRYKDDHCFCVIGFPCEHSVWFPTFLWLIYPSTQTKHY